MADEDTDRLDVAHAAKHLSDLSAAKPPAPPPPPPWQPAWRRRLTSPASRLVVGAFMTVDGVLDLTVGSSALLPLGVIFTVGGPITVLEAWRAHRAARG